MRAFAQMMANGHEHVIDLVKRARKDAKGDVKDLLDRTLPVLEKHKDMAQDLLRQNSTAKAQ